MEITDLTKDVRRLLLTHWTKEEIERHLQNPEYFFDQLVIPRLDYLKQNGEEVPRIRLHRTPKGDLRIILR